MLRIFVLCVVVINAKGQDHKWVWDEEKSATDPAGNARYQIYERPENLGEYETGKPFVENRPSSVGFGSHGNNAFPPTYHGNKGILVGPGGPTGVIGRPHSSEFYRPEHGPYRPSYHQNEFWPGRPTGVRPGRPGGGRYDYYDHSGVPGWIREDLRYREYDTCRCRYSFNCPSTGLKFGSCSRDKRYCCFNSKQYPELSTYPHEKEHYYPRPQHSHGPIGFPSSSNPYNGREPQGGIHGNYERPYYVPGYGYHTSEYENAHNRPYDDDFAIYSRSAQKNVTDAAHTDEKKSESDDN